MNRDQIEFFTKRFLKYAGLTDFLGIGIHADIIEDGKFVGLMFVSNIDDICNGEFLMKASDCDKMIAKDLTGSLFQQAAPYKSDFDESNLLLKFTRIGAKIVLKMERDRQAQDALIVSVRELGSPRP